MVSLHGVSQTIMLEWLRAPFHPLASDLVDVVEEVAALDQQDVVHIGPRGRLVKRQALQAHVTGQVLVQHPRS